MATGPIECLVTKTSETKNGITHKYATFKAFQVTNDVINTNPILDNGVERISYRKFENGHCKIFCSEEQLDKYQPCRTEKKSKEDCFAHLDKFCKDIGISYNSFHVGTASEDDSLFGTDFIKIFDEF